MKVTTTSKKYIVHRTFPDTRSPIELKTFKPFHHFCFRKLLLRTKQVVCGSKNKKSPDIHVFHVYKPANTEIFPAVGGEKQQPGIHLRPQANIVDTISSLIFFLKTALLSLSRTKMYLLSR